jgi:hypothetical protein
MPAGFSGTPLARKLGFTDALAVWAPCLPDSVRAEIETTAHPRFLARPAKGLAAAHVFHASAAGLEADLARLRLMIAPDGMVWVSWPKRPRRSRPTLPKTRSASSHCPWASWT